MGNGVNQSDASLLARLLTRDKGAMQSSPVAREIIKTGRRLDRLSIADADAALAGVKDVLVCKTLRGPLETGLEKLTQSGGDAQLSTPEFIALETVVMLEGIRPSIRFCDQKLDIKAANLGEWDQVTRDVCADIEAVAQSVARINLGTKQMGSGFMVSDDLLMTNRHVLQGIAWFDGTSWQIDPETTFCFADDGVSDLNFTAANIVTTSALDIDVAALDFSKSDYALIQLKPRKGQSLPPALILENSISNVISTRPIYTVGFPGKPMPGAERFSLLKDIFDFDFGVKRYAPGEVEHSMSAFADQNATSVFGHDCTTLGGCSGSPIVDLGDTNVHVVGIHFSGLKRVSNYAHSMAALRNELDDQDLNYG